MNWAYQRDLIKKKVHVWVPSAGKPRRTALTEDQVLKLLGAIVEAPHHIRLLMLIALATGARKQAILDLTWDRVDFENRIIDFRLPDERSILDTSHKKGRAVVDMSAELYGALLAAKEVAKTNHVIEYRGRVQFDPKKGVRTVFVRAGLKRYVTRWQPAVAAGIDMRKVQRRPGHDDINTTDKVYAEFRRGA